MRIRGASYSNFITSVSRAFPEQIPGEPWKQRIQAEFGPCVSLCPGSRTDITVLCDVEGVAISALIDSLSHRKPKVVELAGRLHSRQDMHWSYRERLR